MVVCFLMDVRQLGGAGTGAIVLNGECGVLESPSFDSMQHC